jgi:hypothetical protein
MPYRLCHRPNPTGTIQGTVTDANGAALAARPSKSKTLIQISPDVDDRRRRPLRGVGYAAGKIFGHHYQTGIRYGRGGTTGFDRGPGDESSCRADNFLGQERVTITATPTVDTVKTESSTTINEVTVNTTPILGRKFEDLLTLTPESASSRVPMEMKLRCRPARGFQ